MYTPKPGNRTRTIDPHWAAWRGRGLPRARAATPGFTLIEVLVALAVVGILVAVAYPSYREYIARGQLVDGTNALSTFRAQMERHYQDNRTYATVTSGGVTFTTPCDASTAAASRKFGNFVVTCATGQPTATTFTLLATGAAGSPVAGVVYSISNDGSQSTTMPAGGAWSGWASCATAWIVKKGQPCN